LSLECFEKICLTSETQKGDAFREFFINLRKFIDYYKTHFTNTINKIVQPKKYIYVISVDKNKNIQRFGKTLNIQKKLNNIAQNKEKHSDINFVIIVDEPKRVEKIIKIFINKLKFKNKKELYKINYDTLKSLVFNGAESIKNFDDATQNDKYDTYVLHDEFEENEFLDTNNNVIGYEQIPIRAPIKTSKKISKPKKISKTKKTSKIKKTSKPKKISKTKKISKLKKISKTKKISKPKKILKPKKIS
jgi:hypothetical protein